MRKSGLTVCNNYVADLCLCFHSVPCTIPPILSKSNIFLAISCGCTLWFMSDLIGNTQGRFSHDMAYIFNFLGNYLSLIMCLINEPPH